jgi:proteasome lid subunit RPN8/RPN11
MIELKNKTLHFISEHAEREYPHECGGMLIGEYGPETKTVAKVLPLENAREGESRRDRILILPSDVMRAERYAADRGLDVIGYYHSHPDDRAVPSQYDLDHALPFWSYIIASVVNGKVEDIASWVMENDRSKFNEEEIAKNI